MRMFISRCQFIVVLVTAATIALPPAAICEISCPPPEMTQHWQNVAEKEKEMVESPAGLGLTQAEKQQEESFWSDCLGGITALNIASLLGLPSISDLVEQACQFSRQQIREQVDQVTSEFVQEYKQEFFGGAIEIGGEFDLGDMYTGQSQDQMLPDDFMTVNETQADNTHRNKLVEGLQKTWTDRGDTTNEVWNQIESEIE